MWTGGYNVPPTTITDSVRNDIMFLAEVIGCGEVAISDERATDPEPHELARLVHDAHVGGMLSGKAGLTHVHVGEGPRRLRCIREVLDPERFQVQAEWLYLTHVQRNEALLAEAIELAHQGAAVDFKRRRVRPGEVAPLLPRGRRPAGPADLLLGRGQLPAGQPARSGSGLRPVPRLHAGGAPAARHLQHRPHPGPGGPRTGGARPPGRPAAAGPRPARAEARHRRRGRLMADGRDAVTEGFLKESDRQVVLEGEKELGGD